MMKIICVYKYVYIYIYSCVCVCYAAMHETMRKDDDHRSRSWSTQDQALLASGICISAAISLFFFRFKSKVLSFQIEVGESTINCDVMVGVTMSHGWL